MSEPLRTWPVITLPMSRGRNGRKSRIMRRASRRMSRRFSVRRSPSWMRAKTWIWSRISALEGRSSGLTHWRQSRLAALRLAVKYSVSTRSYIRRAASRAIA